MAHPFGLSIEKKLQYRSPAADAERLQQKNLMTQWPTPATSKGASVFLKQLETPKPSAENKKLNLKPKQIQAGPGMFRAEDPRPQAHDMRANTVASINGPRAMSDCPRSRSYRPASRRGVPELLHVLAAFAFDIF